MIDELEETQEEVYNPPAISEPEDNPLSFLDTIQAQQTQEQQVESEENLMNLNSPQKEEETPEEQKVEEAPDMPPTKDLSQPQIQEEEIIAQPTEPVT